MKEEIEKLINVLQEIQLKVVWGPELYPLFVVARWALAQGWQPGPNDIVFDQTPRGRKPGIKL